MTSESPTSTPSPTPTTSSKKTVAPTPTPTSNPTQTSSPTSNPSTTTTTQTSNATSNPTATPTPTPALKTYTWSNNNVNVKTKCSTGDSTFDIEVTGYVPPQLVTGIWTTVTNTSQGGTIILSYEGSNTANLNFAANDVVNSIRATNPSSLPLKTSTSTIIGYELRVYNASYTEGIPSLTAPLASVSFATD